jgi:hypothetical protein
MTKKKTRKQLPADFVALTLIPGKFHAFYTLFMGLRFPLEVAEVIELRYLINHAVDRFTEPPETSDYRQFRESLAGAIESFSVVNKHHRARLLKTLALMRELHYAHSVSSRDAEIKLRMDMEENRLARKRSIYYGLFFLVATILSAIAWLALPDTGWLVKLLTVLCVFQSWDYFHSLPILDRQQKEINQHLNDVLRKRVKTVHWKTLIHKLALLLGYKHIPGVEVFRMDAEAEPPGPHALH